MKVVEQEGEMDDARRRRIEDEFRPTIRPFLEHVGKLIERDLANERYASADGMPLTERDIFELWYERMADFVRARAAEDITLTDEDREDMMVRVAVMRDELKELIRQKTN